jgi:hypothetical protein
MVPLHYEGSQTRFTGWGGPMPSKVAIKRTEGFE